MVLVATLPGAAVLVADALVRSRTVADAASTPALRPMVLEGVAGG
jgi:hypothetical protein